MKNICPICENPAGLRYRLSRRVYYCKPCRLYFALEASYNSAREREIDIADWFEKLSDFRKNNYRIILDKLTRRGLEKSKALAGLEVGSAFGGFLEVSKEYGLDVVGIEPEKRMYDYAIQKKLRVRHGFFPDDLPKQSDPYDFIIFNDVFEHIWDCANTIRCCRERLKENGVLVLNLPLSTGFFYKVGSFLYYLGIKSGLQRLWQFDFYTPHLYYFNRHSLSALLTQFELEIFDYIKLDAIDSHSLYHRIKVDRVFSKYSHILSKIIVGLSGIIRRFNEDTGVFFIRRKASGRMI